MTMAEVGRAVDSAIRVNRILAQENASRDYTLANLIIKGVSKVLGADKSPFPSIEEVYPKLFDDVIAEREEQIQEQKINLSALRFKQFAQSYNDNFKSKEVAKDK